MTLESSTPTPSRDGWDHSSTCLAVEEAGRAAGREYGLAESTSLMLAWLLNRQAKSKFGCTDVDGRAILDGLAAGFACRQLEELAERLISARDWADWLHGVTPPPPAPDAPAYSKNLEIDLEPSGPSIDTHVKVAGPGGQTTIAHLRIQKCHQPDLDRHLYEESLKIERRFSKTPMVCVILMWPGAEGPGMTGQHVDVDASGRVKRTFTYQLLRAWEMEPEDVTQSPGTMLLAPLTRGARERMPEIVQLIKKGLEEPNVDEITREMCWSAVYWSMGLTCSLEEAHRALGEVTSFIHSSSNYLDAKGNAFREGHSTALREGELTAARSLVLRQATCRFGPMSTAMETLAAITTLDELQALADRVLTAPDWPSLLRKPSTVDESGS